MAKTFFFLFFNQIDVYFYGRSAQEKKKTCFQTAVYSLNEQMKEMLSKQWQIHWIV